ncbi:alpha/beta hydrolase [uncultured Pelagimonas sp.]|uniref:alpha/beta fold hydrolase n=1 Tax=uncultured Pelagimonas sp. TaxID=1618102 RepID=UPI002604183A|nr:alpha/beta hydrolase [uncultured Pelagimonas sp.]
MGGRYMLDGFDDHKVTLPSGISLRVRQAGVGPAIVLIHGYPQTHLCWHKVAPSLVAAGFKVILPDLRGYGDSDKPPSDANHSPYSKRAMATDIAELMTILGHDQFCVAGHDRGARVAHRLARDYGDRIKAVSFLDIAPTEYMYAQTDQRFATAYYHWFFLIQSAPFPETLIGHDPDYYLNSKLKAWSKDIPAAFDPAAVKEYMRCFRDPACIHATCEDYRAAATIDLEHDRVDAGTKLSMPVQVLWGENGVVGTLYDVPKVWGQYAKTVEAKALACGHFLPEEAPKETLAHLLNFFCGTHKQK